ncbi:MAG TPA: trypsin-like peptidase domain-containing protein [Steroidobacteraceae bacterium]|nr:trypsin-like peptidase domain-containing protein [Steroidobacteraceae bacterium]
MKFSWRHFLAAAWLVTMQFAAAQSVPPPPPPQQQPLPQPVGPDGAGPQAEEAAPPAPRQEDAAWSATLARVAESVVAIKLDSTRAFDTEWNSTAQATGFVIDADKGLILTNRHVVTPGPVTAEATFLNREEVQLFPVYRDPVHDFGLYRYDPSKLRFIHPPSLTLYPEGAQVGREIRVIGNNAGEQLSILAGTLARLDRAAPDYGTGRYNDFNTFYLQAASGTSGGSSGSPVVDIRGRVVALNAGGASGSASSFYLPLGRVLRAVELIEDGKPVTRGTLQTVFDYVPYNELARLGLKPDTEKAMRKAFPDNTGMLVVDQVQPGSPAAGKLAPGDILVSIDGHPITTFEPLEQLLDGSIGARVTLQLQRGGEVQNVLLTVDDLNAITPASYLEFGDAVLNNLSYQQARFFNLPVSGVYVANPGYSLATAGVPRGALITEFNNQPVADIKAFAAQLATLADGDRATVRFVTLDEPANPEVRSMRMDRRWFPADSCHRDDSTGLWPCAVLPPGPPPHPAAGGNALLPVVRDRQAARLAPSLVQVTFDMPFSIAGISDRNYHGTGLVVDAEHGLVVTDRNTVPVSLGDVRLTFGGSLEIPGKVVYVHPLHNLAVVSYDPKLIGTTPVRSARFDPAPLTEGAAVTVVGMDADGELKSRATQVSSVDPLQLPLSRTMQFRDSNLETAELLNPPDDFDGVLVDRDGKVQALWSSFAVDSGRGMAQANRGVSIDLVQEMLDHVRSGAPLHTLDVEFDPLQLTEARRLGLPDEWATKLTEHNPERRQVLSVARITGGAPSARVLRSGDLVLAVAGQPVTSFRDVERAVADRTEASVTIWRGRQEQTLQVPTTALTGSDVDRIVLWAGAVLHAPHRAMSAQRGVVPQGVYVAFFNYGSPATRYRLNPGRRIVEVDGQPTPDLDAFLKVVAGRPDRASLRLRTVSWNNVPEVITLKLDRQYWPTAEIVRTLDGWVRHNLD